MVLSPSDVAPFLGHDDLYVRRQARDYFERCGDPSPVTADALWAAFDRLGDRVKDSWGHPLAGLQDLPQTDSSVHRLVDAVKDRPEQQVFDYLRRAARRIDFPLLERHRDLLLGCEQFDDDTLALLQRRLDLAAVTAEQAWEQLMAFCAAAGDKYISQINLGEADALVEAAARHIDVLGPRAVALLEDASIEDYREQFTAQMVGQARYAPATDALFAKLEIDADLLPIVAGTALSQIGTDDILARLAAYATHKDAGTRSFAGEALSRFKRPAAEAGLVALVQRETDEEYRGFLLHHLCDIGSLAGLDATRALIVADPRHPESIGLCESLLAVATMTGETLPEEQLWRGRVDKYEVERAARERELEQGGLQAFADRLRQLSPDFADGPEEESFEGDDLPPPPLPGEYDPYARITPIRNAEPKVGRNDPCPCGSGKKYKKCHGAPK